MASKKFIIFLTDDALPASEHLFYDLCEVLTKHPEIAAATARQIPRSDSDLMSVYSLNEYYSHLDLREDRIISTGIFDKLDSADKRRSIQIDDVCSCYKRDILLKYNFNEQQYAEDLEIGARLIKDEFKIAQLYSTGVIHSHKRPPSYYLKRHFIETKILSSILNYRIFDYEKHEIKNTEQLFNHIHSLYGTLCNIVDDLKEKKISDINQVFTTIQKQLPINLNGSTNSKIIDLELENLLKTFPSDPNFSKNENFLVHDYSMALKNLQSFLSKTYPNLSGIENDFHETLFKIFGVVVGNRLGGFDLFAKKHNLQNTGIEKLEQILQRGV